MNFVEKWKDLSNKLSSWDSPCFSELNCSHSQRIYLLLSYYNSYFINFDLMSLINLFIYLSPYNISDALNDFEHVYNNNHWYNIDNIKCNIDSCLSIKRHYRK